MVQFSTGFEPTKLVLSHEKELVEPSTGIDCVADFLWNRALPMESSSSSFSSFEYSLSHWDYLNLYILRPILAILFTFSLISLGIMFFFPLIILFNSCILMSISALLLNFEFWNSISISVVFIQSCVALLIGVVA